MTSTQTSILIVFVIYLISMVGVGLFFSKKKLSNSEYVLGGRSLNPWVAAMSAQASDMSGWLLTGLPGLAYASIVGAKEAIWTAIGLLIGTFLNWMLSARRLRVYTEVSDNSLTMSSYLGNRFKDKKGILKVVTAVVICIFFTVYASSMFSASAKLFTTIFNIPYVWALVIGVIVIVAYVLLGGFLAVSWTDLFQGLLMFFTLIVVPILCFTSINAGGLGSISDILAPVIELFPDGSEESFGWISIVGAIGWGLGYFGMPHILIRFMAIKSQKQVKPAIAIAMVWTFITLAASILIGVLTTLILPNLADSESVFMQIVIKLFPAVLAGIILSAVLAAIMSTADSQLLVASTSFSNDIYAMIKQKAKKKAPTDKELMLVSRLTVFVLSVIAFCIALDEDSSVFALVQYAWGGLGAAFGPVMLFSLYSKKLNKYGALASILTGVVTTIVFKYGLARFGGILAIYEIVPGFILATAVLFGVSLLTNKFINKDEISQMHGEFNEVIATIKNKSLKESKVVIADNTDKKEEI